MNGILDDSSRADSCGRASPSGHGTGFAQDFPGLSGETPLSGEMTGDGHRDNRVLLVIPAFRESRRLPAFLGPLLHTLRESGLPVVVRVVDDGSPSPEPESLARHCRELSAEFPALLPLIALPANVGKGGAVYAGWFGGPESHWLGFCDADGSVSPAEMARLIRKLLAPEFAAAALIASRLAPGARPSGRSAWRGVLSRLFSAYAGLVTGLAVRDTQCGCKFVRRTAYESVRPRLTEYRFAFDVELLARLAASGAAIREEPVVWIGKPGGSLSVLRDGFRMLGVVLRLRSAL